MKAKQPKRANERQRLHRLHKLQTPFSARFTAPCGAFPTIFLFISGEGDLYEWLLE
jgi:hypothetical protein